MFKYFFKLTFQKLKKKKPLIIVSKIKLATVVEGNQKAPFSIATTLINYTFYLVEVLIIKLFKSFHIPVYSNHSDSMT